VVTLEDNIKQTDNLDKSHEIAIANSSGAGLQDWQDQKPTTNRDKPLQMFLTGPAGL
jgi:hypothetical protein